MIMCSSALNSTEYVTIFNLCGLFFLPYYTFFACKKLCALNDMPTNDQSTLKKKNPTFHPFAPLILKRNWETPETWEKPTANRRESALRARWIGFAYPHSRNPASLSCSSLHRDRSGKSCRRPSGSFMRYSGYSHFSDIFHQYKQIFSTLDFLSCRNWIISLFWYRLLSDNEEVELNPHQWVWIPL